MIKTKLVFRTQRANGDVAEQVLLVDPLDELPMAVMSMLKHIAVTREELVIGEGVLMAMAAHEMGEHVKLTIDMEQVEE